MQLHSLGVAHRDIKPENFLLMRKDGSSDGSGVHMKLADYGLAHSFNPIDGGEGPLTLIEPANYFRGSPAYVAPEIVGRGDEIAEK